MWTDFKRQRMDFLRTREALGELTEQEAAELDAMFAELDAEEAQSLEGARERSELRQGQLKEQITQLQLDVDHLERIRREHRELVAEAGSFLQQLRARRASLADEFRHLTGRELSSTP